MALADRTFSFRAPAQFAQRLPSAARAYQALAADPATATRISRELDIELQRQLRHEDEPAAVQGPLLRAITAAFVTAVERAIDEERLIDELGAFDRADVAGQVERRALLRGSVLARDD